MHHNPFTPGYEVLSKTSYNIDSHGSISNTAPHLITNDFPNYASMFYSSTEHENITSIKYGNFEQDYSNLKEIRESLLGPPIEFYVPSTISVATGGGKTEMQIVPEKIKENLLEKMHKEALLEIINAQKEVSRNKTAEKRQVQNKSIKKIEFEDVLLLRKRKRTIVFENK